MIRPYQSTDKPYLLAIFRRNTPKYFDKSEEKDFEKYLAQKGNSYLTIELDNKIVGGTGYDVNEQGKSGSIVWIFFDPDYYGKGLGRETVECCHTILNKEDGIEKFTVRTSQFAFGFFEKIGYTITRIEKNYWAEGFDLYEMEKEFIGFIK